MCPKPRAIDVTAKAIFERLYLVPGLGPFGLRVNCPYASTLPTVHSKTVSRFSGKFNSRTAPHFLGQHDSPSNLAESRYPQHKASYASLPPWNYHTGSTQWPFCEKSPTTDGILCIFATLELSHRQPANDESNMVLNANSEPNHPSRTVTPLSALQPCTSISILLMRAIWCGMPIPIQSPTIHHKHHFQPCTSISNTHPSTEGKEWKTQRVS